LKKENGKAQPQSKRIGAGSKPRAKEIEKESLEGKSIKIPRN
jgi:hypothetical protein